jgi:hypothetical protein
MDIPPERIAEIKNGGVTLFLRQHRVLAFKGPDRKPCSPAVLTETVFYPDRSGCHPDEAPAPMHCLLEMNPKSVPHDLPLLEFTIDS